MSSFRRYTNLAATIHLLQGKAITLLNPATWDDKNDAYFMAEYKRYKKAETLLALCFAECPETYHHWKVFSNGSDGVCIEFDKERLLSTFAKDKRIKKGYVEYRQIKDLRGDSIALEDLPFLKRYPYQDEREYRVVYVDAKRASEFEEYEIEIDWIERITLSPWMSRSLSDSVKMTLRSIGGCRGLAIHKSTLIDSESWKALTSQVNT